MTGRWVVWFLEEGLTRSRYLKHKQDVEESVRKDTWRGMMRLYVDVRLWEEGKKHQSWFTSVDGGWYGTAKPHWIHYWEISGQSMFLHKIRDVEYLRFIPHGEDVALDIPINAVVSTGSSGFPKVAYSADQYLIGYLGWLDAFHEAVAGNLSPLQLLQGQQLPENFSKIVFEQITVLSTYQFNKTDLAKEVNLLIQRLQQSMIQEMLEIVPTRCKPPYHHVVELNNVSTILRRKHPLVETYLSLRRQFPNIVMGRAFIDVEAVKKSLN